MTNTNEFFKEKKGWSLLKDMIIGDYLKPYISKILFTRRPLMILDCFAGKGIFDDGQDGSPLIIAKHIKNVLENGNGNVYPNKQVYGVFIEKKYADDLENNLKDYKNCKVSKGIYEEHVETFLNSDKINGFNIFLYIDPYGIKSLDFEYFKKIKNRNFSSVELLMNFSVFGFLRAGCAALKNDFVIMEYDDLPENVSDRIVKLNQIAGGEYWQKIIKDKYNDITMKEAEELFTQEYSNKLGTVFKYVIDIPIRERSNNIPKYRLFFGTNHDDGLILMAEKMNKAWKEFLEMEKLATIQTSLEELYEFPDMRILKGYNPENDIKNILLTKTEIDLKEIYVNMILKYGLSYSKKEYEKMLKDMEKAGLIEVLRNPPTTPTGKMATSWDYNYKESIKIRLIK